MKKIKIAVAGAGGRMGKRILALASEDRGLEIGGALERPDSEVLGQDVGVLIASKPLGIKVVSDPKEAVRNAAVLIDFSHPDAVVEHLETSCRTKIGMVIGTTGLSEKMLERIKRASQDIPILQTPNMSVGVNLLFQLAVEAAKILDDRYDIEISETHHRMKKDAPSGTALKIAEKIAEAKGWNPKDALIYGRGKGQSGEREKGKLAIHALRGGDVVGDHTVSFFGDGEIIELSHRATSRDTFARGALLAAKFVAQKDKGLFNFSHVLKS